MKSWIAAAFALAMMAGCGDDGPDTEAGRQRATIVAKLKEIERGIETATDVSVAIEAYEESRLDINAFIEQYPNTAEAEELTQMTPWLEAEVKRLKFIQQASQPPPIESPDIYK